MHCGSVQIDCRRCLRAKLSSLSVEIQRGDVVFTAYAYEHGAVLNPFGCVVSRTGRFCWRCGCADWHSVSTGSGVSCRCDAWSYLSGAPTQWVRYRQGRRGICTHTVVTGSRIPLSRTGLVLAGVLASGTPTEILSPAFDVVKFPQSAVLCASPAQTGRSKLVNQEESSSARHFSLADTRIIGFYSGEEPDHRGRYLHEIAFESMNFSSRD